MYGAIIGDIIGLWMQRECAAEDFELFRKASKFTGETVLTVATAEGLLLAGEFASKSEITEGVRDSVRRWAKAYPDAGFTNSFAEWCRNDRDMPYEPLDLPPAFHISPAGWMYGTLERTREASDAASLAIHRSPSYAEHAGSVSEAVYMARTGASKEEIKEAFNRKYALDLSADPTSCMEDHSWSAVRDALKAFMAGNNFWDAVKKSGGGHPASIAGAIAEAYWGVPASALARMKEILPDEMLKVLDHFAATLGRDGAVDPAWEEISEETAGNEAVADAIRSYKNGERDVTDVYEAVRLQIIREKALVVPTAYEVPSLSLREGAMVSDLVDSEGKLEEHVMTSTDPDGAEWCIAFTDRAHRDAWGKTPVYSIGCREMLEHVEGSERYAGLIINPGEQQMLLSRKDVSLILSNSFGLDWTEEQKAEEEKLDSESTNTPAYMLSRFKPFFKGNEYVFGKLASDAGDSEDDEKHIRLMSGICRQALRNRCLIAALRDGIPSGIMIVSKFKLAVTHEELDQYLLQLEGENDGSKWTAVPAYSSPVSASKAGLINSIIIPIGELLRCVKTWPEDKYLAVDLGTGQEPFYIGREMAGALEDNFFELISIDFDESDEDKAAMLKDMYDAPFEGNEYVFGTLVPAAMKALAEDGDGHDFAMFFAAIKDQMRRKKCLVLPAEGLPAEFGVLKDGKLAMPPEELRTHLKLMQFQDGTVILPSFTDPSHCPEGMPAQSIFVPIDEVMRLMQSFTKDWRLIFNLTKDGDCNPFYITPEIAEVLLRQRQ